MKNFKRGHIIAFVPFYGIIRLIYNITKNSYKCISFNNRYPLEFWKNEIYKTSPHRELYTDIFQQPSWMEKLKWKWELLVKKS